MTASDQTHRRIVALLGVRADSAADAVEPAPSAADVKAVSAVAYRWIDSSARATVYAFDSYRSADAAEAGLRASASAAELTTRSSVNGSLLFWGTADADDERGALRLDDLASRFAGKE